MASSTPYYTRVAPVFAHGVVESLVLLATDVSRLKKAEQALAQSQAQLQHVLSAAQMGIWWWDIDAVSGGRDEQLAAMLGIPQRRDRQRRARVVRASRGLCARPRRLSGGDDDGNVRAVRSPRRSHRRTRALAQLDRACRRRPARSSPAWRPSRRHRVEAARGIARAGPEAREHRPARRRHRARLQQHADRDHEQHRARVARPAGRIRRSSAISMPFASPRIAAARSPRSSSRSARKQVIEPTVTGDRRHRSPRSTS